MPIDPKRKRVNVTFDSPGVVLRGPWTMQLEVPPEQ